VGYFFQRAIAQCVKVLVEEESARGFFIDAVPRIKLFDLLHHGKELGGVRIRRQSRRLGYRQGGGGGLVGSAGVGVVDTSPRPASTSWAPSASNNARVACINMAPGFFCAAASFGQTSCWRSGLAQTATSRSEMPASYVAVSGYRAASSGVQE
jgi:hypothetical protein